MIKDRNTSTIPASDSPYSHSDLQDLTSNCLQDANTADCDNVDLNGDLPDLQNGWKIKLEQCSNGTTSTPGAPCGEKGLSQPLVAFGNIIFNTYIPALTQGTEPICAPSEGSGLTYILSLQDATAVLDLDSSNNSNSVTLDRFQELDSAGIPSAPVLTDTYDIPSDAI